MSGGKTLDTVLGGKIVGGKTLAEEDWHMPIESFQYFIILFRVNQVFTFYHFIVTHPVARVMTDCCEHCSSPAPIQAS